ncbi:hypothetical protein BV133_1449 [Blastochloris viridis]|uniref:Uncharacterized protein n=1 Tax=Blastochloris viridis TaxID=1079 RepID=A0A182D2S5_BLAVI|nr:hypothetical protein BV133_1449 [Blastochloris viridis]
MDGDQPRRAAAVRKGPLAAEFCSPRGISCHGGATRWIEPVAPTLGLCSELLDYDCDTRA